MDFRFWKYLHYLLSPDFKPTFEVFGLSNICLSYKPVSNICTLLHYATCVVYARWPPVYNVIKDRLCSLRLALNCIYRQMFKYFFASHVKGILRCIGNYYMYYLFICLCHVIYISLKCTGCPIKRFTLIVFQILYHVYLFLPNVQ